MTQTLAPNDLFTENATGYGGNLTGYKRYQAWTVADGQTGYAVVCSSVPQLQAGYLPGGAAFTSATTDGLSACLWRPYYATDARASISITLDQVLGSAGANDFRYAGVCGRCSGGTFSESSQAQKYIAGSGYWFLWLNNTAFNSGGNSLFVLLRISSGAINVISTATGPSAASIPALLASPFTMSMQITTVGGNANILCSTSSGGNVMLQTDTSPISAAGRWGFGTCRDRQVAGVNTATLAQFFQIDDIASNTTVHRDEWARANTNIPRVLAADGNGVQGFDLMCMWGRDEHAQSGLWSVDTGFNRIWSNNLSLTQSISMRTATSPTQCRRGITANCSAIVSSGGSWQILVRGTNLHQVAPEQPCYCMQVTATSGPTFTASLRYGSTTTNIIATHDVTSLCAVGSDILFDIQVINVLGVPKLTATLQGAKITSWTPGSQFGPPGNQFTINADGSISDTRTDGSPVMSGLEEAANITPGLSGMHMSLDTWSDLPVVIPGGQAHVSQSLLEGFGKLALQPAHFQPVPHAAVSQSLLELFIDVSLSAHVSQSLIEGFYDTVLKNARVSQSLLEMFIDQGPASNFLEDACIAIGSTGPGCERVSAVGAGVQMLGASGGGVERLSVARARVAAIGCAGPGVERIGVRCP